MSEGDVEEKKIEVIGDQLAPTLETRVWLLENNVRFLLYQMKENEETTKRELAKLWYNKQDKKRE